MKSEKNIEQNLIQKACKGNRNAFMKIVDQNKKKIFYLAYDLTGSWQDAEDLSQEVFLKAYRSIHTFQGHSSISTWLYRITFNTAIDIKRKKSYQMEKEHAPFEEQPTATPIFFDGNSKNTPESQIENQQLLNQIEMALQSLSPRERTVFIMRQYQGMSGREVGDLLDISEGTVKSLLFRAIKKLKKNLNSYGILPNSNINDPRKKHEKILPIRGVREFK